MLEGKRATNEQTYIFFFLLKVATVKEIRILISWHLERRVTFKVAAEVQFYCRNADEKFIFEQAGEELKNSNWSFPLNYFHCRVLSAFIFLFLPLSAQWCRECGRSSSASDFSSYPPCALKAGTHIRCHCYQRNIHPAALRLILYMFVSLWFTADEGRIDFFCLVIRFF